MFYHIFSCGGSYLKDIAEGLPWWSRGEDSMLPVERGPGSTAGQGTRSHMPQTKNPIGATK